MEKNKGPSIMKNVFSLLFLFFYSSIFCDFHFDNEDWISYMNSYKNSDTRIKYLYECSLLAKDKFPEPDDYKKRSEYMLFCDESMNERVLNLWLKVYAEKIKQMNNQETL